MSQLLPSWYSVAVCCAVPGKLFLRELEEFFVNYHELSAEQYRVIDVRGPGQARNAN
jgi:hypothetical protein